MEKPSTPTLKKPPTMGLCELILALKPAVIDEVLIRAVITGVARTLAEVANEFGVESTTLRANWRQQGMPGKPSEWPLADILIWRLKHDASLAERQPGSMAKSQAAELREIEIEEARLRLRKKQRLDAVDEGGMVERHRVEREMAALISVTRERMLRIPAIVEPMLPTEIAVDTRVEIEKQIRRVLTAMGEMSDRQVLSEAHRLDAAE